MQDGIGNAVASSLAVAQRIIPTSVLGTRGLGPQARFGDGCLGSGLGLRPESGELETVVLNF